MEEERTFARLRDWVEPAHPAVIKLHDDLVNIYRVLRKEYQTGIDSAFDRVSRQIGFVVTTTVPMVLEAGDGGAVKRITMGAEHLKGTLFDEALTGALKGLSKPPTGSWVNAGTYRFYLIWFDALKLKLRTEWMEPAHFFRGGLVTRIQSETAARVRPEVMEPAHWFDPGRAIAVEEAALISVIDEVYPELRLVDRVAAFRQAVRVRPEVMEPAHFRQIATEELFRRVRPEVMEPAHFRPESREEVLKVIRGLLNRI